VHHLKACLTEMRDYFPDRKISIAREISKLHEECIRGSLQSILDDYEITEKGEFVIVIDGLEEAKAVFPNLEAEQMVQDNAAMKSRELAAELASRFGISKNQAYEFVLEQRR